VRPNLVDVWPGIDANHADNRLGQAPRGLDDHRAAHRVADQHHLRQTKLPHNRCDIVTESARAPTRAAAPRGAMPGQVDAHDRMPWHGSFYLGIPIVPVAAPAMDEDQSGRAVALRVEIDCNPVHRDGDLFVRGHELFLPVG